MTPPFLLDPLPLPQPGARGRRVLNTDLPGALANTCRPCWPLIPPPPQPHTLPQALEAGGAEGLPNSDLPGALKDKREALGHYIGAKDFTDGVPPGALGPCEPGRTMNFEEKRKLSAHLASLPGEKMQRVVDIVEAAAPVGWRGGLGSEWGLEEAA